MPPGWLSYLVAFHGLLGHHHHTPACTTPRVHVRDLIRPAEVPCLAEFQNQCLLHHLLHSQQTCEDPMPPCLELVCCMLLSLCFPDTCNPARAVTLPNIGIPHFLGVPLRVTYPYPPMLPSVLAVANVEGVHNLTIQTLFEATIFPQCSPRSYISVIASPLILRTRADVNTSPPTCPLQGRRAHVSPNFSDAREMCIRPLQLFYSQESSTRLPQLFHAREMCLYLLQACGLGSSQNETTSLGGGLGSGPDRHSSRFMTTESHDKGGFDAEL